MEGATYFNSVPKVKCCDMSMLMMRPVCVLACLFDGIGFGLSAALRMGAGNYSSVRLVRACNSGFAVTFGLSTVQSATGSNVMGSAQSAPGCDRSPNAELGVPCGCWAVSVLSGRDPALAYSVRARVAFNRRQ